MRGGVKSTSPQADEPLGGPREQSQYYDTSLTHLLCYPRSGVAEIHEQQRLGRPQSRKISLDALLAEEHSQCAWIMSGGGDARTTTEPGGQGNDGSAAKPADASPAETDDFGLPKRPASRLKAPIKDDSDDDDDEATFHDAEDGTAAETKGRSTRQDTREDIDSARSESVSEKVEASEKEDVSEQNGTKSADTQTMNGSVTGTAAQPIPTTPGTSKRTSIQTARKESTAEENASPSKAQQDLSTSPIIRKDKRTSGPAVSEWSHQRLAPKDHDSDDEEEEVQWQAMPALGEFDIYDDTGRIVARGEKLINVEAGYQAMGAAAKGYTRVQLDEDAQSATSLDEDTSYLFKSDKKQPAELDEAAEFDDDEQRDATTQLENTKDLLTEGQRIAYVGVVRLTLHKMIKALEDMERTKASRKEIARSIENMELWAQKMMVRLYGHMEIDSAEQLMIEQLAEHGVQPADLVPPLMQNAKIKNPAADVKLSGEQQSSTSEKRTSSISDKSADSREDAKEGGDVPEVHGTEDLPRTESLELDIRWTVLCDLFLVLISDSTYDSRSRRLLERVAFAMQVGWLQICRFEKRVIDALEGQESELQEDHDEADNLEKRRKAALTRKYVTMGLATVGGGLVIGLSAGLLAPMIGAGLAAGFGVFGIGGTAGFLGGVGGAALITSIGVGTGGTIAVRASNRRLGHVKTFEYRPLHNNKRLNLILTVSGWMTGKVDDVRLPFSTVDPIMGDIYSLYWEPDMLRSTGDTINILATEALTQTVQQVLGSTLLIGLMASLQLPIVLTKLAYLIDNPWNVSLDRANAAGLILADSLMQRHLGARPITLVGFSLGARLIFSCLKELSNRGVYGLIQNVYLFGSPVVARKDDYLRARSVISGRFVNGFSTNDWILGYLFRATAGGIGRVAGLAAVEDVPGLENVDVSKLVNGHMTYRAKMPLLLKEVGWEVESDEFTEIEDPDPENHENRQRELINEIDEARKKAEEEPEKKRFGFFKRGKAVEKKDWEKYDASKMGHKREFSISEPGLGESSVLFDIDAIRRELQSEMIEVRELNSTLPPMQITSVKDGEKHVEYLRLPPEIQLSKEEIGKMNLPPRPHEVDVDVPGPILPPPRTSSLRRSPKESPRPSPGLSPLPSPRRSPSPLKEEEEYVPRELASTLPPLNLTPSMSSSGFDTTSSRPPLKQHATEPPPAQWDTQPTVSVNALNSPVEALNLEHNAWADTDGFGKDKEVKMTFE